MPKTHEGRLLLLRVSLRVETCHQDERLRARLHGDGWS